MTQFIEGTIKVYMKDIVDAGQNHLTSALSFVGWYMMELD